MRVGEALQDRIYTYYKKKILRLIKKIAQTAKSKDDICLELKVIKSTIAGLGGTQLDKERKEELKQLIEEALRAGGCKR